MGTDIDNRKRGPGWYDASCYNIYIDSDSQPDIAAAIGMDKMRQNIQKMAEDPARTITFFWHKMVSTWCDPLYQSIWSGPMQTESQTTYTPLLLSLYGDGKAEDFADMCAKFVSLLLYSGVCAFLFLGGRKERGWELVFLYFIGGVLFHLFWETKSQYVYPYVFCLIPFSAFGLWRLMRLAEKRLKKPEKTALP